MELKAGQKFSAVAVTPGEGAPHFYGGMFTAGRDQKIGINVDERMGMPALSMAFVQVPGLDKDTPSFFLVGSIIPDEPEVAQHRVQFVNTSNYQHVDTDVEVHGVECSHLTRFKRSWEWEAGGDAGEGDFATAEDAFLDYNADFLEEGDGAWAITFFPCSGLVERKKTVVQ